MANLYLFYDGRFTRRDGSGTLKLALRHNGQTVYESLDIHVKPDEWDGFQIIRHPDRKMLNVMLRKKFSDCEEALERIERRTDARMYTARELITMLTRSTDTADTWDTTDYLLPVYNEYIALCRKPNTAATYRASKNNLIEYEPNIDSLCFRDINVSWLRKYQQWLLNDRGMSVNGANVYLRNLRTIFNYAIQNEFTSARYPFKGIDMSTTEPDKRSIPYEKFLEWVTAPTDERMIIYRDLFMLAFYLCGIRPVDLLYLRKDQVDDGRINYAPHKLGGRTRLSIKIEPEAWELIRKYEGKGEYLINVLDTRKDYREFCKHWNMGLKIVGRTDVKKKRSGTVPYITVYFARTLWATFAYNILDIPMDTISQALGHKSGLRVTNFYVKRDNKKVDEANRQMIDRVTADIAEYRATHA